MDFQRHKEGCGSGDQLETVGEGCTDPGASGPVHGRQVLQENRRPLRLHRRNRGMESQLQFHPHLVLTIFNIFLRYDYKIGHLVHLMP